MKKLLLIFFAVSLIITPQISATILPKTNNTQSSFGCSIQVSGEVKSTYTIINLPVGENYLIMYCVMEFIDGLNVQVIIDNEPLNYESGGKIQFIGFFGSYNIEEDDDKISANVNGRALFVKIEGEPSDKIDDSYLPIVNSLDNITCPLDKSPLKLTDNDLESLAFLSDSKIVGLGEATHGTKEFFQLKHRIFKYLVENHDFKIFAFECDMGESYYIDNYVTTGEGNINDIMTKKMHFWTWMTEEVKDLLVWMKEYNENKSDENKIHFIGVDCQFLTYQADIIMNYFNQADIPLSEDILDFLNEINQISPSKLYDYYSGMSINKKEEIDQNVDILLEKIEDSKDVLISSSSEYEYKFIKRLALNIKQVNTFYYGYIHENTAYRDIYMAQNSLWTSELFDENTKVALWAHNMHNWNDELIFGTGSMGYHLKKELKEDYQIINLAFSYGSFTAIKSGDGLDTCYITRQPFYGSINYVFHYSQDENFIIKETDIITNSDFDSWISEPQEFLDIGAGFNGNSYDYYHSAEVKEHYDVLIYWDTTTASELLTWQNNHFSNRFFPLFSTFS